jgi:hypothetical protein
MQTSFTETRQPKSFRALLVDPWARSVTEGYLLPGLAAFYDALSGPGFPVADNFPTDPTQWGDLEREAVPVTCIDVTELGRDQFGRTTDLVIDDEGRMRDYQACFTIGGGDGLLIAGRALIVGSDEGETCGTALPLFEAVRKIAWQPWERDYTPPPFMFTTLEDGETFADAFKRARRGA